MVLEQARQTRHLLEAQHFVIIHAQFAGHINLTPPCLQEPDHDVRHWQYRMDASGAIVTDSRRDPVGSRSAPASDRDHRQVAMQPLPYRPLFLAYLLTVEAIDHDMASGPLAMRDNGLGEPVRIDRQFQQPHFRCRDGIWVVVVGFNLLATHPLHAIHRLIGERTMLMQPQADLVDGFDPLRQWQVVQFGEQGFGPVGQVHYLRHVYISLKSPSFRGRTEW